MRTTIVVIGLLTAAAGAGRAQGLREVPQRFAYIQPVGILLGVAHLGVEFAVARRTTLEIGGIGVYSREDGIDIYGGGPGIGIRQYFGEGEAAGIVLGTRVDAVWLEGDNRGADAGFLAGPLGQKRDAVFLGLGGLVGYRWVSPGGFLIEPSVSYEVFLGPDPLVRGSRRLQDDMGFSAGVAFGLAW